MKRELISYAVQSIWIENEVTLDMDSFGQPHDPIDTNSDVIVTMTDRSRWVATFISYKNIATICAKNRLTGECLNGRYFWASDMVLVEQVTRVEIEQVVQYLIDEREFDKLFARCKTDASSLHKA